MIQVVSLAPPGSGVKDMASDKHKIAVNKALEQIAKLKMPYTNANIAIWQAYFLGENKPLIARIRTLQDTGQAFDETVVNMLYEEYVLRQHMREKMGLDEVALSMIDKSQALQSHIQHFCDHLKKKQLVLKELRRDLSMAEVKEVINMILRQALQEMDEIEQEAQDTSLWLDKGMDSLQKARNLALEFEMNIHRDFLTGVPDYQFFQKQMNSLLDLSFSGLVKRRKFAVFYISQLDHYNQTYSWLLGDSVIRQVTKVIQEHLGDHNGWQMMRYSGAGFVVIPAPSSQPSLLGLFVQSVIKTLESKSLVIKNTKQKIKQIDLCALLVPYEVYDSFETVETRVAEGIERFKTSTHSYVLDLSED